MTDKLRPAVTPSAVMHAERIRAQEKEQPSGQAAQSTAERYAQRILPGYRADEELREQARLNELRARGTWVPGDEEPDEGEGFEDEAPEDKVEDEEPESAPLTTAERYAAVETERRAAEHQANLTAHKSAGRTAPAPVGHRYAAQLVQPHNYADRWGPKPAA